MKLRLTGEGDVDVRQRSVENCEKEASGGIILFHHS